MQLVDVNDKYDRLAFWLNFLAPLRFEPGAPWRVTRAQKEHTDEFGAVVNRGERYFVRRDPLDHTARKLALASAEQLWELLVADNGLTNRVVQAMLAAEERELHQLGYGSGSAAAATFDRCVYAGSTLKSNGLFP